jgi:hypothetical protein
MNAAEAQRLKELESENAKLKRILAKQLLVLEDLRDLTEKYPLPGGSRDYRASRGISERRACQIQRLSRRMSRSALRQPDKDQPLRARPKTC